MNVFASHFDRLIKTANWADFFIGYLIEENDWFLGVCAVTA